ncbi:hypothetical protein B9Z55_011431 [Caenorhabditis nigoni]|nr:hypothetical protein B9Z55_011431 [Caenorhabditis nigoni]
MVFWILSGVIIVRDTWLSDCLKNEKLIEKDSMYLVEKVRYKGMIYDTVIQWSNAMAKGSMPYLYGVYVAVLIPEYPSLVTLATIVTTHGGIICSEALPNRQNFKPDSHPYLHAHLGPIFIIHDGNQNLDAFRTDTVYSLFTVEEFSGFMLKRAINVDTRTDPVPIVTESDD